MNTLSADELLTQATCAVLRDGQIVGTAWLVSQEGHLLTAGHVLGTEQAVDEVEVQFIGGVPCAAQRVEWMYDEEKALDFAILKLTAPIERYALPVSLTKSVQGSFRLCGYGTRLKEASQYCGQG